MFERLAYNGREFERQTREHVMRYAEAGLRTLILAYREVNEDEYVEFNEAFAVAKSTLSEEHEKLIEEVAEDFEKNLILLGATAVEDKLQKGVSGIMRRISLQFIHKFVYYLLFPLLVEHLMVTSVIF